MAESPGLNLEKMVKSQLADSIRNADVLGLLQKMVDSAPDNEETAEVRARLEEILNHYNGLNEEEKVFFLDYLKNTLAGKLAAKLEETPMDLSELESAIHEAVMTQVYLLAAAAVVFVILLGMFWTMLFSSEGWIL